MNTPFVICGCGAKNNLPDVFSPTDKLFCNRCKQRLMLSDAKIGESVVAKPRAPAVAAPPPVQSRVLACPHCGKGNALPTGNKGPFTCFSCKKFFTLDGKPFGISVGNLVPGVGNWIKGHKGVIAIGAIILGWSVFMSIFSPVTGPNGVGFDEVRNSLVSQYPNAHVFWPGDIGRADQGHEHILIGEMTVEQDADGQFPVHHYWGKVHLSTDGQTWILDEARKTD